MSNLLSKVLVLTGRFLSSTSFVFQKDIAQNLEHRGYTVFALRQGEYIKEVQYGQGFHLDCLNFVTNTGRQSFETQPIGRVGGRFRFFRVPEGYMITGFTRVKDNWPRIERFVFCKAPGHEDKVRTSVAEVGVTDLVLNAHMYQSNQAKHFTPDLKHLWLSNAPSILSKYNFSKLKNLETFHLSFQGSKCLAAVTKIFRVSISLCLKQLVLYDISQGFKRIVNIVRLAKNLEYIETHFKRAVEKKGHLISSLLMSFAYIQQQHRQLETICHDSSFPLFLQHRKIHRRNWTSAVQRLKHRVLVQSWLSLGVKQINSSTPMFMQDPLESTNFLTIEENNFTKKHTMR